MSAAKTTSGGERARADCTDFSTLFVAPSPVSGQSMRIIVNMICDLAALPFSSEAHERALRASGVTLRGPDHASDRERDWIAANFGGNWPAEASAGQNWFSYDSGGALSGFATFEQRVHRYWWLEGWLEQADVGIFGPMGVAPYQRGRQVGTVLAQQALLSLKELGFRRALIPAVGPVEFYQRCCGATVIQRLERPA